MREMLLAALLAIAGVASAPLAAQNSPLAAAEPQTPLEARSQQVVALLNGEGLSAAIFTDSFRAAVSDAQLKAISAGITGQFGRALAVSGLTPRDGSSAALEIRLERGIARGRITLAPEDGNRIAGLVFTSLDPLPLIGDTLDSIAADLAALPGSVNAWFGPLDGKAPLISRNADRPLALGSAVKLYVLAALAEDVKAGRRKWTDVVALTQESYPSGHLHLWPKGAPVTLHTLASLMISLSDNTATDQLIATLGKERILTVMADSGHGRPGANDPFLTTRELFLIKASPAALIDIWRQGGAVSRAAIATMIGQTSRPLGEVNAAFAQGPKAIDIEWFASPADLRRLFVYMRGTADPEAFAILAINPVATPAITANWDYIGFKGGSEPGVLNLTWLLTDKEGRDWVLTLGWNNPDAVLDEGKLEALAHRILLLPR
jgi:beta-lactamase class A